MEVSDGCLMEVSVGGLLMALADLEGSLPIGRVREMGLVCPMCMPLGHDLPVVWSIRIIIAFVLHTCHFHLLFEGDLELRARVLYFPWLSSHHIRDDMLHKEVHTGQPPTWQGYNQFLIGSQSEAT